MATNYTNLLGFALPTTGELSGTWGQVVNDSITELVEDSIAGSATASVTSGDWTLSTTGSGASNEARCAILIPTGTPGTSRNIIAPSSSKAYVVVNQSDGAVVLKGAATTGVTIAAGAKALVAWNGSDFVQVGGTGDVVGPASATDNAIVRFDLTSGKLIQNSVVTIADTTGDISGVGTLNATTADLTNLEVTNIKAKDGTAAASIADSTGKITVSTELAVDNLNFSVNTISSTDANGNIVLAPNGTGQVVFNAGAVGTPTIAPTGDLNTGIFFPAADTIAFTEGGVESMRIDSSGRLGLGVTPSAWASSYKVMQIGATGAVYDTSGYVALTNNLYYNGSNNIYLTTAAATDYYQFAGAHIWRNAGSGSAGGTITLTQRLAITAAGYTQPTAYADTVVALGNTGTSTTIDLTTGNVFTATLTGSCTFTLSNPIATGSSSFTLILTNDGTAGRTVAWSGGTFLFPGGAGSLSRTTTANAIDIWFFFTPNGGTTWYGSIPMKNLSA